MLKKFIIILPVALLLLMLSPGCISISTTEYNNRVGDPASDFTLENLEGDTVTLSSFIGQPVMINFWASTCRYCLEEIPLIQNKYTQEISRADGVVMLAINSGESRQHVTSFMQNNEYDFPVLLDTDYAVKELYGVSGIPVTFFIDRNGVIQYIKRGFFISLNELQNSLNKIA
jgi:peroxiredoxin